LAFSRDQPKKVYIQDLMRKNLKEVVDAFISKKGCFYLCGPVYILICISLTLQTWPVPDVTRVLQDAIEEDAKKSMRAKVDSRKEIEAMKDNGRYVLEVY
jgi:sulfite reductase (NADPH) flavoprotein alpha-component